MVTNSGWIFSSRSSRTERLSRPGLAHKGRESPPPRCGPRCGHGQDGDEPVALPQLGQLQPGKGGLGHPADLLVIQAQRIGAVLVNIDLYVRHAEAQVIEHMIAAGSTEFGCGLVGQEPQLIEVLAAKADLNRFIDRRSLFELLDDAARAWNRTVQLLAQLEEQAFHFILATRVNENLREIIGGFLWFDVVVKTGGCTACKHRRAGDLLMAFDECDRLIHRCPHAGQRVG